MRIFLALAFCFCIGASTAQNVQFRSVTTFPSDMSDVWGYSDGEREYALATYEDGWSVVDVTDPSNPEKLHNIPGPNTYWRDIKTYGHYAYGIHEDVGFANEGLIIMDLSQLPDALPVTYWTTNGQTGVNFQAAHNIFIDENGIAYISGHNMGGGVLMLNVAVNPTNPSYLGNYNDRYVHDCFARNDTLWTAEVGAGQFSVVDVRSKSNPTVLARQTTPLSFTHNIWVSDDGRTAFTTDERTGAFLAAYDVSDLNDIREVDRYRSAANVIPHNAIVNNEFVVVSWYSHGIVILDATFPDEMVEVGRFDTAPNYPGPGFHGAWGVYPYLPSGNLLVTDIEEGLVVLSPEYKNATHIRGTVINGDTRDIITGADVTIEGPGGMQEQTTSLEGVFKRGQLEGGTFTISVSKIGYENTSREISLADGETRQLEIELNPLVYTATDTIYAEVVEGESLEICDDNTNGIVADVAFTCGGTSNSELGSWTVSISDNTGCLDYTAAEGSGPATDEICVVLLDEESGDYHANLVIVSILSSITGIADNGFETGSLSLLANPVKEVLEIERRNTEGFLELEIVDLQGRMVRQAGFDGFGSRISMPVDHLNSGLYILTVSIDGKLSGFVKFVKEKTGQ